MKTSVLAILAAISLYAWATPNLDQKISITAKKIEAHNAIKQVSLSTGLTFIVSPKVQSTKKISIDVKEVSLKDVLNFFATELNAKWEARADNSVKFTEIK